MKILYFTFLLLFSLQINAAVNVGDYVSYEDRNYVDIVVRQCNGRILSIEQEFVYVENVICFTGTVFMEHNKYIEINKAVKWELNFAILKNILKRIKE